MRHLTTEQLRSLKSHAVDPYAEWLRVPAMSSGLYVLEAGETDRQSPHREDEIYVVLAGAAQFTGAADNPGGAGGRATEVDNAGATETVPVEPGSVIFVPAEEPHRFHDITKRLEVLVVFAPSETA